MTKLSLLTQVSFKEAITSLELADLDGSGRDNIVISTMNGDLRVFDFVSGKKPKLKEVAKTSGLPPVAVLDVGDILGNGQPDFIVAGLDNQLRLLVFMDGKLQVKSSTPIGTLPTSLVVTNVMDDKSAEVIVATNDNALRCYGWFDVVLDKLAHKVVESPVFSMRPLSIANVPYSRFVFGDENGYLYMYQYADDRLHEIQRIKVGKEVYLVATGSMTAGRYDEVATVSDERTLTVFGMEQYSLESLLSIKTPDAVTALKIGRIMDNASAGQVLLSLRDTTLLLMGFTGLELEEVASLKTASKPGDSLVAYGDIDGDSSMEIVQTVGNNLFVIGVEDE
ncbi:MAG: hypothetical protein ACE5H4_00680 [Candidatus Thorarchaeota archaeon]